MVTAKQMATMKRMTARRRMCAAALAALAGLSASAAADLPKVLDRVPTDVQLVTVVKDVGATYSRVKGMATMLGVPATEMTMMDEIIAMPGLNKDGSMAILVSSISAPGDDGAVTPPTVIMLAPVTDYKQFVMGLGAENADGISKLTLKAEQGQGDEFFAKDLGDGFAAISQSADPLVTFEGKGGNAEAHAKLVGALGANVSADSDVLIVANVEKLKGVIDAAQQQMNEQGEMIAAMAGPQGEQLKKQMQVATQAMQAFSRDASAGVVGLNFAEKGVSIDAGAQFKEGTPSATYFQAKGNASGLLSRVPTTPFYFAMAMDTSSESMKQLAKDMSQANAMMEEQAAGVIDTFLKQLPNVSGFAMVMGASPGGLMGGMLANTVYYVQAAKPEELRAAFQTASTEMNGKTIQGITYKTTYASGVSEVEGVKVDTWTMQMQPDPNNTAAMQMQQAQAMLYGMGGQPAGFTAAVDSGVVMTMSQNTPLMASAIKAVKDGGGLAADPLVKDAVSNLPENRTFEGYIGVKSLMDAVSGLMAMMGRPATYQTPASLAPVVMGGTTSQGAIRVKTFIPTPVMTAVGDFAKSMRQGEEGDEEDVAPADDNAGKPPRF